MVAGNRTSADPPPYLETAGIRVALTSGGRGRLASGGMGPNDSCWKRHVAVLGAGDRIRFLMFTAVMHTDGGSFNCSQVMMRIHSRERQHIADGQQASTCQYHRQR